MPTIATTPDLYERIRKSGLIAPSELARFLQKHEGDTPKELLGRLVQGNLLTPFQAERLAAGKYKGFLLGSYTILGRLGSGGMGQVYLAEHAAMRRFVALKVLPVSVTDDEVARERFLREARAAAALDHPNIVRVYDLNREGKLLYFVMEFVEGASLQTIVEKGGPQPIGTAAAYAWQAAKGLQHAHERDLVHRDIKPANILVDRAGLVRILDLGLVRNETENDSKLTAQLGGRSILGTADYLAPEQAIDSSNVDTRADLYSLGATLYFLLAGHPLFPGGRAGQKLMWQQWREPTPICELRPDVPPELGAIVHKAIAKRREDRFQSPYELQEALAPFAVGPTPPNEDIILPPPTRSFTPKANQKSNGTLHRMQGLGTRPDDSGSGQTAKLSAMATPAPQTNLSRPAMPALTPPPKAHGYAVSLSDFSLPSETAETVPNAVALPAHDIAKPYSRSTLLIVALLSGIGVALAFIVVLAVLFFAGLVKF